MYKKSEKIKNVCYSPLPQQTIVKNGQDQIQVNTRGIQRFTFRRLDPSICLLLIYKGRLKSLLGSVREGPFTPPPFHSLHVATFTCASVMVPAMHIKPSGEPYTVS